jgi:hypothetical protein
VPDRIGGNLVNRYHEIARPLPQARPAAHEPSVRRASPPGKHRQRRSARQAGRGPAWPRQADVESVAPLARSGATYPRCPVPAMLGGLPEVRRGGRHLGYRGVCPCLRRLSPCLKTRTGGPRSWTSPPVRGSPWRTWSARCRQSTVRTPASRSPGRGTAVRRG